MLHICCSNKISGPRSEDYFGHTCCEAHLANFDHNIYSDYDHCEYVDLNTSIVVDEKSIHSFQNATVERAEETCETSKNDALVAMLRKAISPKMLLNYDANFLKIDEYDNGSYCIEEKTASNCSSRSTEKTNDTEAMDTHLITNNTGEDDSTSQISQSRPSEQKRQQLEDETLDIAEVYNHFLDLTEAPPPVPMIIFENSKQYLDSNEQSLKPTRTESQDTRSKTGAKSNGPPSKSKREEGPGSLKKKHNGSEECSQPFYIRLYEDSKRLQHKQIVPANEENAPKKKTRSLTPNAAQLRLYSYSKKFQEDGKRRRKLLKDNSPIQPTLLGKPQSDVHLRLYRTSEKFQKEGKELRMKIGERRCGARVEKVKNVQIRPNPTQLRLYKQTTKSQLYSLKAAEQETDLSISESARYNIAPNPTQLRLYEKSKKLQIEGKQRRDKAASSGDITTLQPTKISVVPSHTQIRLYNKSKHLQEEGKHRRTICEEKINVLSTKKAFTVSRDHGTSSLGEIHINTHSQESFISLQNGKKMKETSRNPFDVNNKAASEVSYSSRFHELRATRDLKTRSRRDPNNVIPTE